MKQEDIALIARAREGDERAFGTLLSKYEREDVSPSWLQIERLLDALGQSPCALFPECSAESEAEDSFFSVSCAEQRHNTRATGDLTTVHLDVLQRGPR